MNTYEIFTEFYSTIIEAYSMEMAVRKFREEVEDNPYVIIAALQVNHSVYKEFIR
jgi:hypothetical protein